MIARGNHFRNQRRIVIGFDEQTFVTIAAMAKADRTSFAEQARLLIEWGLEAANAAA